MVLTLFMLDFSNKYFTMELIQVTCFQNTLPYRLFLRRFFSLFSGHNNLRLIFMNPFRVKVIYFPINVANHAVCI
jgi:hypothetical protein